MSQLECEFWKECTAGEDQKYILGRGGEVDGIGTETDNFVGDVMFDSEPVELFENGSYVCMFWGIHDKSGCTILNMLKFLKEEIRETKQENCRNQGETK